MAVWFSVQFRTIGFQSSAGAYITLYSNYLLRRKFVSRLCKLSGVCHSIHLYMKIQSYITGLVVSVVVAFTDRPVILRSDKEHAVQSG